MRKNGFIEVITGVNEGETVITSGQQGVLDGRGVSVQSAEFLEQLRSGIVQEAKRPAKNSKKKKKKAKLQSMQSAIGN